MKIGLIVSKIVILIILLPGCSMSSEQSVIPDEDLSVKNQTIKVDFSDDTNQGNYVFTATHNNCTINWYLYSGKHLKVRYGECKNKSFLETKNIHRAILSELFNKWEIDNSYSLDWGNSMNSNDYSGAVTIALASINSAEYQDYRKNYPNSKITNINSIYKKLANETELYKDLNQLFNEFGTEIELSSVEKIFTGKVSDLPFEDLKDQLKEMGISDDEIVIYGAAMTYFNINIQNF